MFGNDQFEFFFVEIQLKMKFLLAGILCLAVRIISIRIQWTSEETIIQ